MLTIINNSTDPFYNLAFEEFVFQNFKQDDIFLLWQDSPSVIVGRYQNICREVHIQSLRKLNIPVLRRITGGGTVYHDLGNVNFTYITTQRDFINYDRCLAPIIRALNAMGIPAYKDKTSDIALAGLKISGNAQKTANNRVLHHGTLLFNSDLAILDKITTHHKNDCFKIKGTHSAICSVTNISDHLPTKMNLTEFKQRLLEQMLLENGKYITLTQEQEAEIIRLRDEKYRTWEWTWGKTPNFTYEKTSTFGGKSIFVAYQSKKGRIFDVQIKSDVLNCAEAMKNLECIHLNPKEIFNICRNLVDKQADELMDCLI